MVWKSINAPLRYATPGPSALPPRRCGASTSVRVGIPRRPGQTSQNSPAVNGWFVKSIPKCIGFNQHWVNHVSLPHSMGFNWIFEQQCLIGKLVDYSDQSNNLQLIWAPQYMDPTWRPCFSGPLTRRTFCARPSAKNIGSNVSTEQKMAGNTNCIFAFCVGVERDLQTTHRGLSPDQSPREAS